MPASSAKISAAHHGVDHTEAPSPSANGNLDPLLHLQLLNRVEMEGTGI